VIERLILARHGESEFSMNELVNGDPTVTGPLTPRGREQAVALGGALSHEPIDLCVVTEFPRVRETADIALEGRDIPRRTVSALNDPRAGRFEGGAATDYRAWHDRAEWYDAPPGGGESQLAIIDRYLRGYAEVLACPVRCVLVVAHALPIGFALALIERDEPPIRRRYDDDVPLATPILVPPEDVAAGIERARAALQQVAARRDTAS
jgi:2,3-bisphosphoglycerate-dependent phosphoglycerate mutase